MSKVVVLMIAALLLNSMLPSEHRGSPPPSSEAPGASEGADDPTSPPGVWVRVTEKAAFSPRDTAEDLVFGGRMWLSNGYYHGNVLTRDLWSSTDGAIWTLVSGDTPYDGYSEMVAYDGKMWAIKGSVWCSTDGVTWRQVLARTPFGARGYGEVVVHDGKLWQLGSGEDVWYSTDGGEWTCATRHAPYGARRAAAVAAFRGRLWVMGGNAAIPNDPPEKQYPEYTTYNDVWSSADGVHWECVLKQAPWAPRMWFVSKVYADRMWIVGGFDNVNGANLGDVWHTEDGANWRQFISRTTFSPRHEPTCYVYDDSLWVVAGNSWPVRNDVWRLTLRQGLSEGRGAEEAKQATASTWAPD